MVSQLRKLKANQLNQSFLIFCFCLESKDLLNMSAACTFGQRKYVRLSSLMNNEWSNRMMTGHSKCYKFRPANWTCPNIWFEFRFQHTMCGLNRFHVDVKWIHFLFCAKKITFHRKRRRTNWSSFVHRTKYLTVKDNTSRTAQMKYAKLEFAAHFVRYRTVATQFYINISFSCGSNWTVCADRMSALVSNKLKVFLFFLHLFPIYCKFIFEKKLSGKPSLRIDICLQLSPYVELIFFIWTLSTSRYVRWPMADNWIHSCGWKQQECHSFLFNRKRLMRIF